MATSIQLINRVVAIILCATALVSCAGAKKHGEQTAPSSPGSAAVMGPPEAFGPPAPAPVAVDENYGPQPIQYRPITLVLGPGMARGFAHAGVLRALSEKQIPISAIVGTEMGALMGALYALSGSLNRFEWSLQRFKDTAFLNDRGIMSAILSRPSSGKTLEAALQETLGGKKIEAAKPKLYIVMKEAGGDGIAGQAEGDASRVLRGALATPGLMTPGEDQWVSASSVRPFPVSEGRLQSMGPVVVIDLLDEKHGTVTGDVSLRIRDEFESARRAGARDIAEADLVIRPDMSGVGYLDFSKRTVAAFRGRAAAQAQMNEIRRLIGLPVERSR